MAITGSIGRSGDNQNFSSPVSLNVTCPANQYPNGTFTLTNLSSGRAYWRNNWSGRYIIDLYLCDSAGNNAVYLFRIDLTGGAVDVNTRSATVNAPGLAGKALYIKGSGTANSLEAIVLKNQSGVSIDTASTVLPITCNASAGGSLSASTSSATPGSTVTLYPNPNTGYYLTGYTSSPSVSISNNKFTMPNSAVTITANFAKISYTISKGTSPSGAGTVTTSPASSATMGTSVTVSQTPATGYYFNGWQTSPALTISGGAFTMPASNVSITAKYLKRSTASLSKSSMAGGSTVTMTITSESSAYTHKYTLSFGTGMTTGEISVAAGVTSVTISIPESWSNQIPNAASKTGGTLTLKTFSGSTQIGTYTISSLTYTVPASAVPVLGTITKSIARTIDGTTYADVGDYYVQNHCGVRVQGSATTSLSATISQMTVSISGYSGSVYNGTSSGGSIDFTSGLLTIAGITTITVTATDSRGRTTTETTTVTVDIYNNPAGTLQVWRVDEMGDPDDVGLYARFELTKSYTAIGTNSLTVTLTGGGSSETTAQTEGDILPNSRKQFSLQQEYTITMTLADAFETTVITKILPSARFIIYVSASGKKMGFMKAATNGGVNDETIEFSGDATIYIGNKTLAEYIEDVVNNM